MSKEMKIELAQKRLNEKYEEIKDNGIPTFRGVRVDEFSTEDRLKLIYIFADIWTQTERRYLELLGCPEFVFRKELGIEKAFKDAQTQ